MQSKTTELFFISGLFLPVAGLFFLLLSACGEGYWSEVDEEDPHQRPAVYEEGVSFLPSAVPLSNPPAFSAAGSPPSVSQREEGLVPPAVADRGEGERDQDQRDIPSLPPEPSPVAERKGPVSLNTFDDRVAVNEASPADERGRSASSTNGILAICSGGSKKVEGHIYTELTYHVVTEGLPENHLCELDYSATRENPDWWALKTKDFCQDKMMEKTHRLIRENWDCEIHRGFEICIFSRESDEWLCQERESNGLELLNEEASVHTGSEAPRPESSSIQVF